MAGSNRGGGKKTHLVNGGCCLGGLVRPKLACWDGACPLPFLNRDLNRGRAATSTASHREMNMRLILSASLAFLIGSGAALAFPTSEVPTSEPAYLAKVKTAAPDEIVAKATITMTQDGEEKTLQTGTNGFTCFIGGDGTPLCGDDAGIAWFKAIGAKSDPPKQDRLYLHAGRGH